LSPLGIDPAIPVSVELIKRRRENMSIASGLSKMKLGQVGFRSVARHPFLALAAGAGYLYYRKRRSGEQSRGGHGMMDEIRDRVESAERPMARETGSDQNISAPPL
jgi:hypothetical protein